MTVSVESFATAVVDPTDLTQTTLIAQVTPSSYSPRWLQTLLNLTISLGSSSTSFPSFSFAYDPPPFLTSISGCEGSGLLTTACIPGSSILTFQGSGMRWLGLGSGIRDYVQLNLDDITVSLGGQLVTVNDSAAALALSSTYQLLPRHYNGVPLPISFTFNTFNTQSRTFSQWSTNNLSVSFVSIPLPPSPTSTSLHVTPAHPE